MKKWPDMNSNGADFPRVRGLPAHQEELTEDKKKAKRILDG
jgi:hypothetical protein